MVEIKTQVSLQRRTRRVDMRPDESASATLRDIDGAFCRKFRVLENGNELAVADCNSM